MKSRHKKRFKLYSPGLGILPFLILCFLLEFINLGMALFASLGFGILLLLLDKYFFKNYYHNTNNIILLNTFIILINVSIVYFIIPSSYLETYNIFIELCSLIPLSFLFYKKKYLSKKIFKHSKEIDSVLLRHSIYEIFYFIRIFTGALCLYIFIYGITFLVFRTETNYITNFVYLKLRWILILSCVVFEHSRIIFLNRNFRNGMWLPIINEESTIVGHIAKETSYSFKEKYLHPSVRILIFYKNMVFLTSHKNAVNYIPGYDTPLRDDLNSFEDYDECMLRLFNKTGLSMHERPNFITRYYFENKIKRRMICLFTYNIKNEDTLKLPFFKKGKFWSENEIDMNRDKSVFTDAFEKEINLLKLSVFAIQH